MADTNFMFDELDKNMPLPPAAPGSGARPPAPRKAEDIFSDVDKSVKPEVLRPRDQSSLPASTSTVIPPDDSWLKNKGLLAGLALGGLVIIIGGSYLGLRLMVKDQAPAKTEIKPEAGNNQTVPEVTKPAAEEAEDIVEQPIQPVATQPVDSDLDGLTDEEEVNLGTSSNSPDTDGDGLTDREEAKVYSTEPLIADTDGDGYPDGEEVKNGYNPKGPGKLLDINNQ